MPQETKQITVGAVKGIPLVLDFSADAIREHFDENEEVGNLTDAQLAQVAQRALSNQLLYNAFHASLHAALLHLFGIDAE